MISRGEVEANQAKVQQYGLTFPIVLQQPWEISREYAMFGTPIAYLIDEAGLIAAEPAVGLDAILALLSRGAEAARSGSDPAEQRRCRCGKLEGECGCGKTAIASVGWRRER
jgi:hypothetical protein